MYNIFPDNNGLIPESITVRTAATVKIAPVVPTSACSAQRDAGFSPISVVHIATVITADIQIVGSIDIAITIQLL
jgi:hypothetical protein